MKRISLLAVGAVLFTLMGCERNPPQPTAAPTPAPTPREEGGGVHIRTPRAKIDVDPHRTDNGADVNVQKRP